jgi:hypothetical protein
MTTSLPYRPAIHKRSSGQHSDLAKYTLKKALDQNSPLRQAVSEPATPQIVGHDAAYLPHITSEPDLVLSMNPADKAQNLTVHQLGGHGVGPAASDTPQPSLPGSPRL